MTNADYTRQILRASSVHFPSLELLSAATCLAVERLAALQAGTAELTVDEVVQFAIAARQLGVDFADWMDGDAGTPFRRNPPRLRD